MVRKIGKTTLFAIDYGDRSAGGNRFRPAVANGRLPLCFCGTTCSATVHCGGLCTCWIDSGQTTGFCAQDPPAAKPKTK